MWGVILCHLVEEKILSKTIKDHPISVGAYIMGFVSNSGKNEALEVKYLRLKLRTV